MPRYNEKRLSYAIQEKLLDMFCEIILSLKNKKAIKDFLKDLLNRQERAMLVRRLLIAKMLMDSKTYQEIVNRLHCGNTTISRVERWLNFGREGYKKAISIQKRK